MNIKEIDISIDSLSFSYENHMILEDITLEVYRGDYLAIIGPNGGGKSTLLKLLLGFLKPTKGDISIFGKSIKEARSDIGYLPQHINFNLDMPINVLDIVLQGRLRKDKFFYTKSDKKIAQEKLEFMGVLEFKDRKIKELSGGQRQKVLLSRALAKEPKILILDEPTASIDLSGQKEIYRLLKDLPLTKLVVSHDINILFEGVTKVAYINKNLYLHDESDTDIYLKDGHFCEVELLDYFRNHKCLS